MTCNKKKLFIKIKYILVQIYNDLYDFNKIKFLIIHNYFNRLFKYKPRIMTIEDSIQYILDYNCSLSRYGDGEMKIIMGEDLPFQPYSDELAMRLKQVLKSDEENHKVGIPDVFSSLKSLRWGDREFWENNIKKNRHNWYNYLDKKRIYINAFISRPYMIFKNRNKSRFYFEMIKKLWYEKDIIIIEGIESRLGVGNDLFDGARSINRILAPSENAFLIYKDILELCTKLPKNKVIFIALGPTATILAYDLYNLGYQAIDIGHIDIEYEWYLKNATNKININNKYVHELKEGRSSDYIYDEKYEKEVIYRF